MSGPTARKAPRRKRPSAGKTRPLAVHKGSRAGAKLLKGFYRAKHGAKPDSPAEARAWYAQLVEAKYRVGGDPQAVKDAMRLQVGMEVAFREASERPVTRDEK